MVGLSGISLNQFYGIEIENLAHEIAHYGLQTSNELHDEFGQSKPTFHLF